MTLKQELTDIFNKSPEIPEGFIQEYYDEEYFMDKGIFIKMMESRGGEGEGEDCYTVYSFIKGTELLFVKFQGSYFSYLGSELTEWFFAAPIPSVGIQYVRSK